MVELYLMNHTDKQDGLLILDNTATKASIHSNADLSTTSNLRMHINEGCNRYSSTFASNVTLGFSVLPNVYS